MRETTTDGRVIERADMCTCCTMNSAGQHQADCPCREDTVLAEADLRWYNRQLQATDHADDVCPEIVWTPEGSELFVDEQGHHMRWEYRGRQSGGDGHADNAQAINSFKSSTAPSSR